MLAVHLDQVDGADRPAGVADRARDLAEHPRSMVDLDPEGEAVLGARRAGHGEMLPCELTAIRLLMPRRADVTQSDQTSSS